MFSACHYSGTKNKLKFPDDSVSTDAPSEESNALLTNTSTPNLCIDEEAPGYIFASCPEKRAFELARGRVYWTGSWWRDYWYHVRNAHPLFSCCCCDSASPYTRSERTSVFLAVLLISVLPAAAFLTAIRDRYYSPVQERLYFALFFTLPVVLVQLIVECTVHAREAFKSYPSTHKYGPICARLYKLTHALVTNCSVSLIVLALVLNVLGCLFIKVGGRDIQSTAEPLLISRVEFWVIWFATDMYMPWVGFSAWWKKERRQEELRLEALAAQEAHEREEVELDDESDVQSEESERSRSRSFARMQSTRSEWESLAHEDRFSCRDFCALSKCLAFCCPCNIDLRINLGDRDDVV